MRAINIEWETDGEIVDLPREVEIPEQIAAEARALADEQEGDNGHIADWLSDQYGWLVNGLDIEN